MSELAELLAEKIATAARKCIADYGIIQSVRPAFAIALELLEREGLIPTAAPELREVRLSDEEIERRVREFRALAEAHFANEALAKLRRWLTDRLAAALEGESGAAEASSKAMLFGVERHTLELAIQEMDRATARRQEPPRGRCLRQALRLHGVDLGADTTEALAMALASLDEAVA